jgi:hypothetical protein
MLLEGGACVRNYKRRSFVKPRPRDAHKTKHYNVDLKHAPLYLRIVMIHPATPTGFIFCMADSDTIHGLVSGVASSFNSYYFNYFFFNLNLNKNAWLTFSDVAIRDNTFIGGSALPRTPSDTALYSASLRDDRRATTLYHILQYSFTSGVV